MRTLKQTFSVFFIFTAGLFFNLTSQAQTFGTFYLASQPSVPYPFDPYGGAEPIRAINAAQNIYLVEDSADDYATLQAVNNSMRASRMSRFGADDESPDDAGSGFTPMTFTTNDLWLEITGVSADKTLSYLVVHPPATNSGGVYDLFATTNLNSEGPGLNVTNWTWILRTQPGQTNLTVTNLPWATQCYFMLGATNDSDSDGLSDAFERLVSHSDPTNADTDGDGMPDGWEWNSFQTFSQTADDDYDEDGISDWLDYANHFNPVKPVVFAWGLTNAGQCNIPTPLNDAIALAGGGNYTLILRETGTVIAFGTNDFGQVEIPPGTDHVIAIAAGDTHGLALKKDGTVAAWGRNDLGQTSVPSDATNVIAISAGGQQSLALKNDGTVVQWGQTFASLPASLTNVVAIASGWNFHLALRADGSVVAWGDDTYGQTNVPPNLTNVVAVAAGGFHALALRQDGTIVAWGSNSFGETNVPSNLTNAMAIAAGYTHSIALRNDGTVVAWGDNTYGQTNVPSFSRPVKLIGAGGYHSLAGYFMRQTQYPVSVSQDLLLIYNINSVNSAVVKDYYLAHRPMVQDANVLGIGCTTNETFLPDEYTNVFAAQVQNWLAQNPTKRPQYVILFPDIPSRVNTNNTPGVYQFDYYGYAPRPSVQCQLNASCSPGWHPFVTSINLNTTNDCEAYINKLEFFGTNFSPGQLVISAAAENYGDTNYYFDPVNDILSDGARAKSALLPKGVSSSAIFSGGSSHITLATNVTGYLTWGVNGGQSPNYSIDGSVAFVASSGWYLIETVESFNGQRYQTGQGNFLRWFMSNSFGGTNYSNTPIGAVCHVDEPTPQGANDPPTYFGSWATGKNFAICAWYSRETPYFQAVGDPFVTK
jgi:hypothetical protein